VNINTTISSQDIHTLFLTFSSTCKPNEILIGGDCSWDILSYRIAASSCRASDFVADVECGVSNMNDCIQSIESDKGDFDGNNEVILSSISSALI